MSQALRVQVISTATSSFSGRRLSLAETPLDLAVQIAATLVQNSVAKHACRLHKSRIVQQIERL